MLCAHGWAGQTQLHFWRRILQSKIRNSAAAESEGGQKFLPPPTPFLFARPSVRVLRAKRAIILGFAQKMFEHQSKNTAKNHISKNQGWKPRRKAPRHGIFPQFERHF